MIFLYSLILQTSDSGGFDPSGGYSVRGAYIVLTSKEPHSFDATSDLIWHKEVPLKFLFWLGDFFEIGCRQRTIWWRTTSFLMTHNYT